MNPIHSLEQMISAATEGVESPESKPAPPTKDIWGGTGVPDRYRAEWQRPADQAWKFYFDDLMASLKAGGTVALIGSRGVGKTRLACEAMRDGAPRTGTYASAMEIFVKLRNTFRKNSEESEKDLVEWLAEASLLIIDEVQERGDSSWEDRVLTHVLDLRYGAMRPTILIGNLTAESLEESLGASILSRLTETGGVMEITGPSFREIK